MQYGVLDLVLAIKHLAIWNLGRVLNLDHMNSSLILQYACLFIVNDRIRRLRAGWYTEFSSLPKSVLPEKLIIPNPTD